MRQVYQSEAGVMADASAGRSLVSAMKSAGMSMNELSARTGLSVATIRRLRRGEYDGNLATWRKIARVLGATLDELVG